MDQAIGPVRNTDSKSSRQQSDDVIIEGTYRNLEEESALIGSL